MTEVEAEEAPVAQEPLTGDEEELLEVPEAAAAEGDGERDTPAEAPAEAPDPDRPDETAPAD